jgi:hypothetical protein
MKLFYDKKHLSNQKMIQPVLKLFIPFLENFILLALGNTLFVDFLYSFWRELNNCIWSNLLLLLKITSSFFSYTSKASASTTKLLTFSCWQLLLTQMSHFLLHCLDLCDILTMEYIGHLFSFECIIEVFVTNNRQFFSKSTILLARNN